ncbi:MAG: T9SS type A sorting domain-containing protein, partial [Bacteroidota bacterium]
ESFEEPGIANATQVVWLVANDMNDIRLFGSPPIGIEMQITYWTYDKPYPLNNSIFKRVRLIYKGTSKTPPTAFIDSMYLSIWSDPDLGDYGDDYVGCDTLLQLGYVYNSTSHDENYLLYDEPPPAVGYTILQGPIVSSFGDTAIFDFQNRIGYKNVPMTSFTYCAAGMWYASDCCDYELIGDYSETLCIYNLMQGRPGTPIGPPPPPFTIDPITGQLTKYWLNGNPITNSGWIDGFVEPAGDRRFFASSGEFSMALGDTQEFTIALAGGMGNDRLSSLVALKKNTSFVRTTYSNFMDSSFLKIPKLERIYQDYISTTETQIHLSINAQGTSTNSLHALLRQWDDGTVSSLQLFDDGLHYDRDAGDNIFGNTFYVVPQESILSIDIQWMSIDGKTLLIPALAWNITTIGNVNISDYEIVSDNLNNDGVANPGENIRFALSIKNNLASKLKEVKIKTLHGATKKKISIPHILSHELFTQTYNQNDTSSYFSFDVPEDYALPYFTVILAIIDSFSNEWFDTLKFSVRKITPQVYLSSIQHKGNSDWNLRIKIIDATKIKNHQYEIVVVDSADTSNNRKITLRDNTIVKNILTNYSLPESLEHNIPVTDGFKIIHGENWGKIGFIQNETKWITEQHPNFSGYGSSYYNNDFITFHNGIFFGHHRKMTNKKIFSSFDSSRAFSVEIRFDTLHLQKAYRLIYNGNNRSYLIDDSNSFVNVPFTVWDVSSQNVPTQLTIAWVDGNKNGKWGRLPNGVLEPFYIYDKEYDSSGTFQFSMPPNVLPNEATQGSKANIIYGVDLIDEENEIVQMPTGTLLIRPYHVINSSDTYTFNPIHILNDSIGQLFSSYTLLQNYPNPFNPTTFIKFYLPQKEKVQLKIFDILGREIATVIDEVMEAGEYRIPWKADGVSSGIYFYHLEAGKYSEVKKMLLLK